MSASAVLRPRALRAGDLVVVAALSGPLEAAYESDLGLAVGVLEGMGFRVRLAPLLEGGRRHWWSAGRPVEIAEEFNSLLRDPEVRAVVAHDGGQTALGYLDLIDFDAVVADPKPILGYSDISLLHLVLHGRTGLAGFHADLATPGLGGYWQRASVTRRAELEHLYLTLLTSTEPVGALPGGSSWECWRPGRAEGRLIGGVINRIVLNQAMPYAIPPGRFDGAVLFWEEMGGQAAYVWSYLQVLRHSGILDRIAGMVVGVPHQIAGLGPSASPASREIGGGETGASAAASGIGGCGSGVSAASRAISGGERGASVGSCGIGGGDGGHPSLREIVLDVVGDRDIPILGNVDIGHAGPNLPLPVGVRAALNAGERTLSLLEPAVRAG
ncbi:S66 peptidase family protein [Paractinoplanes brasiliensis]|uniref:Muramoyltetrapeptide carboxypeptidase n=1 Tax=Paractinoplanes brasiliensis TaxID=52695 RepID=A0A4R6JBC1_9ACTN|nr:LD-carboxypeptidase [Actinoplanes brasiliensis]TDO32221.1 muramoyltetrapeptide carboxypeptidase [Actinoplanes brasiliensis]